MRRIETEPRPDDPLIPFSALSSCIPVPTIVYDGEVARWALAATLAPAFHTWWWVRAGNVSLGWRGARLLLGPGDWIFFPVGWTRRYRIEEGTRLVSLSFELRWGDGRNVLEMDAPARGEDDRALLRRAESVARACRDPRSGLAEPLGRRAFRLRDWLRAEEALHRFIAALIERLVPAGARVTDHRPMDAQLQALATELVNPVRVGPLPYERWARSRGLSRAQIDRMARRHFGTTLREWRDAQLAREVQRQLKFGGASLKEIAAALGFVDQAHFNHWVKRRLGATPSQLHREWHA